MDAVLITGATDGIGLELARFYRSRCRRLILVGRRPREELADEIFETVLYCRVDLSRDDAAEEVATFLIRNEISTLSLVIQNAGIGYFGASEKQTPQGIDSLLAVNLYAPIALAQRLIPPLRRGCGRLVFISSVVAYLPCPDYAVYGATKNALDEFARSLRIELADVPVVIIHPGATRTRFHQKMGLPAAWSARSQFASPATVAATIAQAISGDSFDVVLGTKNNLMAMAGKFFPGLLDTVMCWSRK